ncbi:MAG: hypothetical protein GX149_02210 [Acholeplasmataceae bacterium]|jgi:hypothetical protein|nr:hypothetical protein [Acholeplasmataceae bacterium]
MKKLLLFILILLLVPMLIGSTYNYSFYGNVIHSSPGMTFVGYFDNAALGTKMSTPEYFVVYEDDIYLVDSGTNELTIIDSNFNVKAAYSEFSFAAEMDPNLEFIADSYVVDENDNIIALTLKKPLGIDVKPSGIYIADTDNERILKLNHNFEVVDVFSDPQDPVFEEMPFKPSKITVDVSERMYVVVREIFEGIVELSSDGTFNRFTGVNPIRLTAIEIFRRSFMTEAQLAKLRRYLPTEYTSVTINENSFIYATSKPSGTSATNTIQLINPKGVDVINRTGYFPPMGDIHYLEGRNNYVITGPSQLVDIDYTEGGIYSVLDQRRSRIFTYDSEGNLLYINGSAGRQSDKFAQGVAVKYLGDDLIVLDRSSKTFIVYRLSEFGELVNQAIKLHDVGKFDEAAEIWEELLTKNANYEIAYNGIGKYLLREGRYKEAIENFKLGHDSYYYSKAYKEYRNQILRDNFGYIFLGIVVLAGLIITRIIYKKHKKGESLLYED